MSNSTSVQKLTQERLKELLNYNPETGIFVWAINRTSIKAGIVAGSYSDGYIRIGINSKGYLAHRLAWLYVEGYLPENDIDHINRDKTDNRFSNLRETTKTCNLRNRGIFKNNKTGITGVMLTHGPDRYQAYIKTGSKSKHLGMHVNIIDAARARWNAEVKYKYPNCNTTSSAYQYLKEHDKNFKG